MRKRIYSDHVAEPPPQTWSNFLVSGDLFFIAGLTSRALDGDTIEGSGAYEQARLIFGKMKHYLDAAGGSMNDILKLTIFVADISFREAVWRARREFFEGDFPACSLIEVSALAKPEMLVEIEGTGRLGSAQGDTA